jgi:hypothetical protein
MGAGMNEERTEDKTNLELRKLNLDMAKIHEDGVKSRREYEWKLAFGFWTGIGAFTAFVVHEGIRLSSYQLCLLGVAYFLLFVLAIAFWFYPLQQGHAADRNLKHYFMDKADGKDRTPLTEAEKWKWSPNTRKWFIGQIIFTVIFLMLSLAIIKKGKPPEKSDPSGDKQKQEPVAATTQPQPAGQNLPVPATQVVPVDGPK